MMRMPLLLIASTCSRTVSTNVTSWLQRARYAPSVPPIAPDPQIRNSIASGVAPAPGEQLARLVDGDLPDGDHVVVAPLIHPAIVSVADVFPQRDGVERADPRDVDHRPLRRRHRDAGEARPWKVLHPGS